MRKTDQKWLKWSKLFKIGKKYPKSRVYWSRWFQIVQRLSKMTKKWSDFFKKNLELAPRILRISAPKAKITYFVGCVSMHTKFVGHCFMEKFRTRNEGFGSVWRWQRQ